MNMQSIMAQAQKMQRDITKKKEELDKMEFTGKSEWFNVVVNGKKEVLSVKCVFDNAIEADEKDILEDMITLAINDAFKQVDKATEEKLGQYSNMGGLF